MSTPTTAPNKSSRFKFIVGGILLLAAVGLMVLSATKSTADFFLTVAELQGSGTARVGENLRVSGAVLGDSIDYHPETGMLHFTIAHIPADEDDIEAQGGLAAVLHQAVINPTVPQLAVVYAGAPPDMLKNEAQAVLTGTLQVDGTFLVEELLLKCPSKYEDALQDQVEDNGL